MSGLTGFIISLSATTASKGTIEILDILLAIFFGLIVSGVSYISDKPNPFMKDENDK
jgi:hypothetical protein